MNRAKTWKREAAAVGLGLHWALIAFICWLAIGEPEQDTSHLVDLAKGFAVWVYGFAGAAFGLDAFSKQIKGGAE